MLKFLPVIRMLVEGVMGLVLIAAIPTEIAIILRNFDNRPAHALADLAGMAIFTTLGYYLARDAGKIYNRRIKKTPKAFKPVSFLQPYGE